MNTINSVEKSIRRLSADTDQVRGLLNKDLEAWTDADNKAAQLWIYLQAMSEALMKSNQSAHELQALFSNATTMMRDSSIALLAGLERYDQGISAIENRVITLLSQMSLSAIWSPLFLILLFSFYCLLLQSPTSWKLRAAVFLPMAYQAFEVVRGLGWKLNFRATRSTLAILCRHLWLLGIAFGAMLAALCIIGLRHHAVARKDGGLLPRVEVPSRV